MRTIPVAAVAALLIGCASPDGAAVPECIGVGAGHDPTIATGGGAQPTPMALECWSQIGERRLELLFDLPAGPSCHVLERVEIAETGDAVAITLTASVIDDPLAGACPERPVPARTEVDLQAPFEGRRVVDGSRAP